MHSEKKGGNRDIRMQANLESVEIGVQTLLARNVGLHPRVRWVEERN